ncbi:MAG: hypothetical protein ACPL5I_12685 [Thermodesulfobacteriota bacterium]
MNHHRKLAIILLIIALLIPWNIVYFYYTFYSELDLLGRKHFSEEQENALLNLFEKKIQAFIDSKQSIQLGKISSLPGVIHYVIIFVSPVPINLVLRC